jgi:signal peptidase I
VIWLAVPARDNSHDPEKSTDIEAGESTSSGKKLVRGVIEFVVIIAIALGIATLMRAFLVQPFYVPSGSMEQTLQINDRVIASKISTNVAGVKRGEIMVFKDPSDWLPSMTESESGLRGLITDSLIFIGLLPSDSGDDLVKRVIAIEGDQIACCNDNGQIVLNGVGLDESSYISGPTDQVLFDVTVPPGSMFVMGDNRGNSADSRFHLNENEGSIPVDNAVGRVVLVVWPFDRFSTQPIPEIFGNPAIVAGNPYGK